MKISKTRKQKKSASSSTAAGEKTMTIPQLRSAFGTLEKETHAILENKAPAKQVEAFQALWKRIFKRTVSESAAREYLEFKKSSGKRGTTQRGGAAPISWQMGPGVSEPYGQFQTYMGAGLTNYNLINNDSFRLQCGREDSTPTPTFAIGNNTNPLARGGSQASSTRRMKQTRRKQKGGMARLVYPSSVPSSFVDDLQLRSTGQLPVATSPSAVDNVIPATNVTPPLFTGSISKTTF